jgi:hypothetical protein
VRSPERTARFRDRVEHRKDLAGAFLAQRAPQPACRSFEREREALLSDRLQQVVHCRNLERTDRVFVVCRDENHGRHPVCPNSVNDGEAVNARHLDVEQDEVRLRVANGGDRFAAIPSLRDRLDAGVPAEEQLQPVTRQRLVVHHENLQPHHSSSDRDVRSGSVMVTRTPRSFIGSTESRASSPYNRARRFVVFVRPIPGCAERAG